MWEQLSDKTFGGPWSGSGKLLWNSRWVRVQLSTLHTMAAVLLTSNLNVLKEYVKVHLNPTDMLSLEEWSGMPSTWGKITEVAKQLLGSQDPGVDEIHCEVFKALGWHTSATLPGSQTDWDGGSLFKKGDQWASSSFRGIIRWSLPWKVYARVLGRTIGLLAESGGKMVFSS